ncbi:hypothetical protein ON010_g15739 [Phytophthora cinnamomi]|nr:hypothetical protein ON010_g15739 [Phytophthora cinnamomi]
MMWTGLLPLPLAALILGRDGMLIGGTFYHRLKTKDESSGFFDTSDSGAFQVKPSMLSKVNTALQLSVFGLALTNAAWQIPPDPALNVLFGIVGTTTFLSGSEYLYGYMTKTGAFKPLPKAVERPLRKAVERTEAVIERTEAVVKRTEEVVKRPLQKAVQPAAFARKDLQREVSRQAHTTRNRFGLIGRRDNTRDRTNLRSTPSVTAFEVALSARGVIVNVSVRIASWCLATLLAALTRAYARHSLDVVSVVVDVGFHVAPRAFDALVIAPIPWLAVEGVNARPESGVVAALGPSRKVGHGARVYPNFLRPSFDTGSIEFLEGHRSRTCPRAHAAHGLVALIAALSRLDSLNPFDVVTVQVHVGVNLAFAEFLDALVIIRVPRLAVKALGAKLEAALVTTFPPSRNLTASDDNGVFAVAAVWVVIHRLCLAHEKALGLNVSPSAIVGNEELTVWVGRADGSPAYAITATDDTSAATNEADNIVLAGRQRRQVVRPNWGEFGNERKQSCWRKPTEVKKDASPSRK